MNPPLLRVSGIRASVDQELGPSATKPRIPEFGAKRFLGRCSVATTSHPARKRLAGSGVMANTVSAGMCSDSFADSTSKLLYKVPD